VILDAICDVTNPFDRVVRHDEIGDSQDDWVASDKLKNVINVVAEILVAGTLF
jgi:hypothetical protein